VTPKLAHTLLEPLFQLQGVPTEEARRMAVFTRALQEAKDPPDPSIHAPHFDSIRESLLLIDDLANQLQIPLSQPWLRSKISARTPNGSSTTAKAE
jgi:hypothetical protein